MPGSQDLECSLRNGERGMKQRCLAGLTFAALGLGPGLVSAQEEVLKPFFTEDGTPVRRAEPVQRPVAPAVPVAPAAPVATPVQRPVRRVPAAPPGPPSSAPGSPAAAPRTPP